MLPFAGAIVALLTILPLLAAPVPVTQDGPSHVYNAAIAAAARRESAPFAQLFDARADLRPNVASHWILTSLGPRIGWRGAERAILVVALLGCLLAALIVARKAIPVIVFSGWLASNWFFWMGFYDFVLSVPCFVALTLLLTSTPTTARHIAIQVVLAALYLTHLFTFAAGVAATLLVFAQRATQPGRAGWREIVPALPALFILLLEVMTGVGGPPRWTAAVSERLRDAATGDFVTTVVWLDGVVGSAFVLGMIWVAWRFMAARGGRLPRWSELSPLTVFGVALLVLSVAAPDSIGEGGYVPARMRLIGALAVLPVVAGACARLSRRTQLGLGIVLSTALAWRSVLLRAESYAMQDVTREVSALLARAGARDGAWMVTRLAAYRRWPFRVGVYRHLGARVAVERGLIVLNNYEALYGVFSVSWRARPDWVQFRRDRETLLASFVPGTLSWNGPMYVLHERAHRVHSADPRMTIAGVQSGPRFAVTTLRQQRGDGGH
jgi:hypothetical protein